MVFQWNHLMGKIFRLIVYIEVFIRKAELKNLEGVNIIGDQLKLIENGYNYIVIK